MRLFLAYGINGFSHDVTHSMFALAVNSQISQSVCFIWIVVVVVSSADPTFES